MDEKDTTTNYWKKRPESEEMMVSTILFLKGDKKISLMLWNYKRRGKPEKGVTTEVSIGKEHGKTIASRNEGLKNTTKTIFTCLKNQHFF